MLNEIIELDSVNREMSALMVRKKNLELKLCKFLAHPDGMKASYNLEGYEVTLTGGWNYKIDKDVYFANKDLLIINPIKEIVKLEVDEFLIEELAHEKLIQAIIKEKTPKKAHVKIVDGESE